MKETLAIKTVRATGNNVSNLQDTIETIQIAEQFRGQVLLCIMIETLPGFRIVMELLNMVNICNSKSMMVIHPNYSANLTY
jgi:hypothetical protein